jgi:hypothetical protein
MKDRRKPNKDLAKSGSAQARTDDQHERGVTDIPQAPPKNNEHDTATILLLLAGDL